jgi:hypothetical protein
MYRPTLSTLARMNGSPQRDAEARQKAQFGNFMGSTLPALGTALGTVGGASLGLIPPLAPVAPLLATAGGAMGGAYGGMAGNAFQQSGEEALDPVRERELRKAALMEMLGRYN